MLFTAVNVGLTMGLGTLIALLLKELRPLMRSFVTTALVLAWAMPVVVAAQLWLWMTNYENGVLNYVAHRSSASATSRSTTGSRTPTSASA